MHAQTISLGQPLQTPQGSQQATVPGRRLYRQPHLSLPAWAALPERRQVRLGLLQGPGTAQAEQQLAICGRLPAQLGGFARAGHHLAQCLDQQAIDALEATRQLVATPATLALVVFQVVGLQRQGTLAGLQYKG